LRLRLRWRRKRQACEHKRDEQETASQRRPARRISYWRIGGLELNRLIHNGPPFFAEFYPMTIEKSGACQYDNYRVFDCAGFSPSRTSHGINVMTVMCQQGDIC